jgi:hypothetical protein
MSVNIEGDPISPSTSCTTEVINQLVSIIHELQDEVSEVRDQLASQAKRNAKDRRRVSELEDEVSNIDDRDTSDTSEDQSSPSDSEGEDGQSTSLEQVCALSEEESREHLTANQKRARSIATRIDEYGKSVPAGVAITSSRIRDILSGLEDKRVHRQTVQRVADFLKRFGDGHIERKSTRGGKDVVVFSESIVEAITSVVTGEKDPGVTPAII